MTNNTFRISIRDLEDGPLELNRPLPQDWLNSILTGTDVEAAQDSPGTLSVVLTKTGTEVLVQGQIEVCVSTPCARTLDPAIYRLRPDVFLMLSPGAGAPMTETPSREPSRRRKSKNQSTSKKGGWSEDGELAEPEAAQDTYSGDEIVLDEFIREFILLEVPMVPLREDLRDVPFEANPPLPDAQSLSGEISGEIDEESIDPRLSPLRELKARLENKE